MKFKMLPLYLSAIITSAHFLREGSYIIAFIVLLFPLINLVNASWVRWALIWFSGACAIVWAVTTRELIAQRIMLGEDWTRMAIILGAVVALNIVAGVLVWLEPKKSVIA